MPEASAHLGGQWAKDLVEVRHDAHALDAGGWWAVALTFEGTLTAARFASVARGPAPRPNWPGVPRRSWTSTMTRLEYLAAVDEVRTQVANGEVYQVNVCRALSAPMPATGGLPGLAGLLAQRHPSPFAGYLDLPDHGVSAACASPELFLRRDGAAVSSGPIKGTGRHPWQLADKDRAENVMIVDMVRNDLGQVCTPGSVTVPALLSLQAHPGLVHLVSTVAGTLRNDVGWPDLLAATFPPASVSGAPKRAALEQIVALEPAARGLYCGALGWVDADRGTAELAVAIRTFVVSGDRLSLGTGAGITWGSDAAGEWDETDLKTAALLAVAEEDTCTRG